MTHPRTLIYIRNDNESTDSLLDQFTDCVEYIHDELGIIIPDSVTHQPIDDNTQQTLVETANTIWAADDGTYPNTLEEAIRKACDGEIDRIVVPNLYTLSDSVRDIHGMIDSLSAGGVAVHVACRRVVFEPTNRDARRILYAYTELERRDNDRRIDPLSAGEKHTGGRPPVGYTVEDCRLRPSDEYDKVESVLHAVVDGRMSIHRAASKLNVSRTTIRNAIDERSEMYGLPEDAERPNRV